MSKKKSSGEKSLVVNKESSLAKYCHFMYKNFGRNFLRQPKFKKFFYKNVYNTKYETILKKANLKIIPEEYFVSIYLTILLVMISIIVFSFIFFFIDSVISSGIFFGGIVLLAFLGIFLYNYPIVIANTRGKEIDAAIPYLLPYMKILSKELNLSKIIEIIEDFLIYKEIKVEFRKIKYYSDFLGNDIQSSIREAMQSCPSRQLSDMLNDLVTISNSGGDIYGYLDRKLENLNQEINAIEKKNLDTLLIFSQIYVVLLLIAPLFFTIMSSILNLIQSTTATAPGAGGETSNIALIMMMLAALPFVYAGFMMLIYYTKPLYSRLKPINQERVDSSN